jgi:hypothetical protein
LTINGGTVYLECAVYGNLNQNGGTLILAPSATVFGNLQISKASAFTLGAPAPAPVPGAAVNGNLIIQNLSAGLLQQGTVCGVLVQQNLQVQNNGSPIEIGAASGTQNCAGNRIVGNLQCTGNTSLTGGKNSVQGSAQGQCATFTQ